MRDLNGAEIDVGFSVREGDSTSGVSNDPKDNEEYSDDGGGLHSGRSLSERQVNAICDCDADCGDAGCTATVFSRVLVDSSNRE